MYIIDYIYWQLRFIDIWPILAKRANFLREYSHPIYHI